MNGMKGKPAAFRKVLEMSQLPSCRNYRGGARAVASRRAQPLPLAKSLPFLVRNVCARGGLSILPVSINAAKRRTNIVRLRIGSRRTVAESSPAELNCRL
jgi:hypothetical protein